MTPVRSPSLPARPSFVPAPPDGHPRRPSARPLPYPVPAPYLLLRCCRPPPPPTRFRSTLARAHSRAPSRPSTSPPKPVRPGTGPTCPLLSAGERNDLTRLSSFPPSVRISPLPALAQAPDTMTEGASSLRPLACNAWLTRSRCLPPPPSQDPSTTPRPSQTGPTCPPRPRRPCTRPPSRHPRRTCRRRRSTAPTTTPAAAGASRASSTARMPAARGEVRSSRPSRAPVGALTL